MVFQAKLDGEVAGPGLFGDPAVGAAFQDEPVFAGGFDDAAKTVGGFVEVPIDIGAALAGEFELVGSGEAGDAAADDSYSHRWLQRDNVRGVEKSTPPFRDEATKGWATRICVGVFILGRLR